MGRQRRPLGGGWIPLRFGNGNGASFCAGFADAHSQMADACAEARQNSAILNGDPLSDDLSHYCWVDDSRQGRILIAMNNDCKLASLLDTLFLHAAPTFIDS